MSSEKGSPTHPYWMHNTAMPRGGLKLLDIRDRNRERDPAKRQTEKAKSLREKYFLRSGMERMSSGTEESPLVACIWEAQQGEEVEWRGRMGAKGSSMWESGGRLVARRQYLPIHQSKNVEHGRNIRVAMTRCALQVLQCLLAEWHSYLIATLGCILDHQIVQCP